jgi:hypothetical protein
MNMTVCALLFIFPVQLRAQTALSQLKNLAKDAGVDIETMVPAMNVAAQAVVDPDKVLVEYKSAHYTPDELKPALENALAAFDRAGVKVISTLPLSYSFRINYEATFKTYSAKETVYTCPGWSYNRFEIKAAMADKVKEIQARYSTAYGELIEGVDSHSRLAYTYKVHRTYTYRDMVSPEFGSTSAFDSDKSAESEAIAADIRRILRKRKTTALEVYVERPLGFSNYYVRVPYIRGGGKFKQEMEYSKTFKTAQERDEAYAVRLEQLKDKGAEVYYKKTWDKTFWGNVHEHSYAIYYIP